MLNRILVISSVLLTLLVYSGNEAFGQLITDSDKRLKTQKTEKQGGLFGLFRKKKVESASGPLQSNRKAMAPRYSTGSPFAAMKKRKGQSARPSVSERKTIFKDLRYTSPRYSTSGLAGIMSGKKKTVRYGATRPPFTKKDKLVAPRFSAGSPFTRKEKTITPRYSAGSPFTKKQKTVTPRYSLGSPFTKKKKAIVPRYSAGSPFTKKEKVIVPRYSGDMPFSKKDRVVSPRYSSGSPFANVNWKWIKPRYSTYKDRFENNESLKLQMRPYNVGSSKYSGTNKAKSKLGDLVANLWTSNKQQKFEGNKMSVYRPKANSNSSTYSGNFKRKWIGKKEMHPSFRHNKAQNDSEIIRTGLRKWSVFWTRLNRNKVQPDAVTEKISKPKFDRKETEIWNN